MLQKSGQKWYMYIKLLVLNAMVVKSVKLKLPCTKANSPA